MMENTKPEDFRLYLTVQMNRPTDNFFGIPMDDIQITMDGQELRLLFWDMDAKTDKEHPETVHVTLQYPDYDFGDTGKITKDMLSSVKNIDSIRIAPVEGNTYPVKLLACRFELPDEGFRKIFLPDCPVQKVSLPDLEPEEER